MVNNLSLAGTAIYWETNLSTGDIFPNIKDNIGCLDLKEVDVLLCQGFGRVNLQNFTQRNLFVVVWTILRLKYYKLHCQSISQDRSTFIP